MEQYDKEMLKKQREINLAFGRIYFAIYSIDISSDEYLEIATLDIFREHIPPKGKNQLLFDMVVKYYVTDGYKDGMSAFLDMSTLQERLSVQNAVSKEFLGTTQGWCRASFVVEKRDADGKVLSFAYVTQEINEEVKHEQSRSAELKRAYEAADLASSAKSNFLFQMSHDIRTPLNAIMGFEYLIENFAEDSARVREYAEKIKISANLLLSLLNDILDMTKIESGKAVINLAPFSLDELIDELEEISGIQAKENSESFAVERNYAAGSRFVGDRTRISRVLLNVLGNAIKYTEADGKIVFSIREETRDSGGQNLIFSVRDSGIGIADDFKALVYDKFTRGREAAVSRVAGTGLGLTIAKNYTELLGGEISVESEQGKGSEFTVMIPVQRETSSLDTTEEETEIKEKEVFEGLNVLVVEDNDLNMEIITGLLEMAGARCDTARNGREALEKMEKSERDAYDLIAMDVCMPEMNGYEATKRIRALKRPDAKKIPIVALTANAFKEDVEEARNAGMDAHLAKPLNMTRFRRVVKGLLERKK